MESIFSWTYDCFSRVENILPVCSCHLKMCFLFSTYPPFKLNAFDTTGPWRLSLAETAKTLKNAEPLSNMKFTKEGKLEKCVKSTRRCKFKLRELIIWPIMTLCLFLGIQSGCDTSRLPSMVDQLPKSKFPRFCPSKRRQDDKRATQRSSSQHYSLVFKRSYFWSWVLYDLQESGRWTFFVSQLLRARVPPTKLVLYCCMCMYQWLTEISSINWSEC